MLFGMFCCICDGISVLVSKVNIREGDMKGYKCLKVLNE